MDHPNAAHSLQRAHAQSHDHGAQISLRPEAALQLASGPTAMDGQLGQKMAMQVHTLNIQFLLLSSNPEF